MVAPLNGPPLYLTKPASPERPESRRQRPVGRDARYGVVCMRNFSGSRIIAPSILPTSAQSVTEKMTDLIIDDLKRSTACAPMVGWPKAADSDSSGDLRLAVSGEDDRPGHGRSNTGQRHVPSLLRHIDHQQGAALSPPKCSHVLYLSPSRDRAASTPDAPWPVRTYPPS